ncbi:hypothetical protein NQ176_g8091 [Zarea fungicola]|uniref:Uncharacterized protein n=1 Tax=Zarea fungicola TaxID=93591 RepID=A0ACC1MUF2_9HYPO|nr:hypothetical protein NQ176_g8091 [Lecanicillium fungicola]
MRLQLLPLVALSLEFAQADSGTCGTLHTIDGTNGGDGCWKRHYWETFWTIREDFCSQSIRAGDGPYVWKWTKFEAQGQITLQPHMTNSRCWDAFYDIIFRCFDSDRAGATNDGQTHETGQWTTDNTQKEWYWLWGNTRDGWCLGCGDGCKNKRSLDMEPMKRYSPAEWEAIRTISAAEQAAIDAGLATDHRKRLGISSNQTN